MSSAKGQHGGPRPGSGRKPVLTFAQEIAVSAEYERLWGEAGEIAAYAKYYGTKKAEADKKIEVLQRQNLTLLHKKLPRHLRWHRSAVQQKIGRIKQELDRAGAEIDKIGRRLSLPLKRPKGLRAHVTAQTIARCKKKYGIEITARRVADCRAKYRRFLKQSRRAKYRRRRRST
jgi:hypothetical protein